MKSKLTETLLKSLEPADKPYTVRDTEVTGFLLRVMPSGGITYYLDYRSPAGTRKSYRIEKVGNITAAQARQHAKDLAGRVARGEDIQVQRQCARRETERNKTATLRAFMDAKYSPWASQELKSGKDNVRRIKANFPDLLNRRMADITEWQIEKWRSERRKAGRKSSTINRDLMALRSVLTKAVKWNVLDAHPLSGVKASNADSTGRARYLSATEEKALRKALHARDRRKIEARARANAWRRARGYEEYPNLSNAAYFDYLTPMVLLALNTGLRRGELFSLCRRQVDLDACRITVKGITSKSGRSRYIPLNNEAAMVMKSWLSQSDSESELVFPAASGRSLQTVRRAWTSVLSKAGITDFRLHDLRHHFASRLVMRGIDLYTVSTLLGHSSVQMTERYSHLAPEHLEQAVAQL